LVSRACRTRPTTGSSGNRVSPGTLDFTLCSGGVGNSTTLRLRHVDPNRPKLDPGGADGKDAGALGRMAPITDQSHPDGKPVRLIFIRPLNLDRYSSYSSITTSHHHIFAPPTRAHTHTHIPSLHRHSLHITMHRCIRSAFLLGMARSGLTELGPLYIAAPFSSDIPSFRTSRGNSNDGLWTDVMGMDGRESAFGKIFTLACCLFIA
jgi:hypothetical protein